MKLSEVLTMDEIIENLVTTVSCGGNMLLNVGPDRNGVIPVIFQQRLKTLGLKFLTLLLACMFNPIIAGDWLNINGEAIYSTKPYELCQNDTKSGYVWYTVNNQVEFLNNQTNVNCNLLIQIFQALYATVLSQPGISSNKNIKKHKN